MENFSIELPTEMPIYQTQNAVKSSLHVENPRRFINRPVQIGYIGRLDNKQKGLLDFFSLVLDNEDHLRGRLNFQFMDQTQTWQLN